MSASLLSPSLFPIFDPLSLAKYIPIWQNLLPDSFFFFYPSFYIMPSCPQHLLLLLSFPIPHKLSGPGNDVLACGDGEKREKDGHANINCHIASARKKQDDEEEDDDLLRGFEQCWGGMMDMEVRVSRKSLSLHFVARPENRGQAFKPQKAVLFPVFLVIFSKFSLLASDLFF